MRRPLLLLALVSPLTAQIDPPQLLPGDLGVAAAAGDQLEAVAARGDGGYLAVWEEQLNGLTGTVGSPNGLHANRDIGGILLDTNGDPVGAPFLIGHGPWHQEHPRVAWNGTHYLVVWESQRPTEFAKTYGIHAARVAPDGTVLDEPAIVIDDLDDAEERWPVVASDGSGWLVSWQDQNNQGLGRRDGAYVSPTGLVLQKSVLVSTAEPLPTSPELAAAGSTFLLVYERNFSSGVSARRFDNSLQQLGAEIDLGTGFKPAVASDGVGFCVGWLGPGGVRATPIDAAGGVAVPGGAVVNGNQTLADPWVAVAHDGVGWSFAFEDLYDIHGAQMDAAGALVPGSPYLISAAGDRVDQPAMANGPGFALALWDDWRLRTPASIDPFDVFAARVHADQNISPAYPVSIGRPAQVSPCIAGDAEAGHLVVFRSLHSGVTRIVGQRLDEEGAPIDAEPFLIAQGGRELSAPDLAWDGVNFLVCWSDNQSAGYPQTFCVRVAPDASVLDPAPIYVQNGTRAAVAAAGGQFLVISWWHHSSMQSNEVILAARFDASTGVVLDPGGQQVAFGSGRPAVTGFDDRWLVVWGAVAGAFVHHDGTIDAPFYAANTGSGSTGVSNPAVASNDEEALLVWQYNASLSWNSDLRARRIHKDGTLLDFETGSFVSSAPNWQGIPSVGWYGGRFLVAWTDFRDHPTIEPGMGDVYATRVLANNQVLDPEGLIVHNAWPTPEGQPDVGGDEGLAIITAAAVERGEYGTWRVTVSVLGEGAVGTNYCGPAQLNSSNAPAFLVGAGSTSAVVNDLTLTASQMPQNQPCLFVVADGVAYVNPPGSNGFLCLGGQIGRMASQVGSTGTTGTYSINVDLTSLPLAPPHVVLPGETWNFQAWFRDQHPGPTSNFTDGLSILFK